MRLVVYARCSTQEQAQTGHTLAAQVQKCKAWAALMEHEVVLVVEDSGVSGAVPPAQRLGFRSALDLLVGGKADGLVAISIDRISRGAIDMMELSGSFLRNKWSLFSLRDPIDVGTATGRLMLGVLSVFAQFERELTGERIQAAVVKRRSEGLRVSGWIPWGWRKVSESDGWGKIEVEPVEEALSVEIIQWTQRRHAAAAIADYLNSRGTLYPRNKKAWRQSDVQTVRRSLRREGRLKPKFTRRRLA